MRLGFVVAAKEPVGEGAAEERDGGEDERVAEGTHGLGVEVEEVTEGEGVVAGVLFEEVARSVSGPGGWAWRMKNPAASAAIEPRASSTTEMRWPARDEWVGDGEGFGFVGFIGEPGGDEKDQRGERGEDVVLLAGGEAEEEQGDGGPEAEEKAGALRLREGADGDAGRRDLRQGTVARAWKRKALQGMSQMRRSPQKRARGTVS